MSCVSVPYGGQVGTEVRWEFVHNFLTYNTMNLEWDNIF
jgi:hypothetical protein